MQEREMVHKGLYELRSIDAWREPEGGWSWNESWHIEYGVYIADDYTVRGLLKFMRRNGWLTEYSKGRVQIYDDGDVIEIQERNGRPLLAFIPF